MTVSLLQQYQMAEDASLRARCMAALARVGRQVWDEDPAAFNPPQTITRRAARQRLAVQSQLVVESLAVRAARLVASSAAVQSKAWGIGGDNPGTLDTNRLEDSDILTALEEGWDILAGLEKQYLTNDPPEVLAAEAQIKSAT